MLIYFIIFLISILFMMYGYYLYQKKLPYMKYIIMSCLPLIGLASLRSIEVGTDTKGYQTVVFFSAINSNSFNEYLLRTNYCEIGYRIICYIVSRFTSNIHILFGVNHAIIIIFIVLGIWHFRDSIKIYDGLWIYLLLYYCTSLNLLRQSMALAIVFFACTKIFDNNYKIALLFLVIACLIHTTAFIALLFLILYQLMKLNKKKTIYFICIASVFFSFFYQIISTKILSLLPGLPSRYRNGEYLSNDTNIQIFRLLFNIICLIIIIGTYWQEKTLTNWFLLIMSLLSAVFTFIVSHSEGGMARLILYFEIFNIIIFPKGINFIKKKRMNYVLYYIITNTYIIAWWLYSYFVIKADGVNPYKFSIERLF